MLVQPISIGAASLMALTLYDPRMKSFRTFSLAVGNARQAAIPTSSVLNREVEFCGTCERLALASEVSAHESSAACVAPTRLFLSDNTCVYYDTVAWYADEDCS